VGKCEEIGPELIRDTPT